MNKLIKMANQLYYGGQLIPLSIILLLARIAPAGVFWRSGQTKVDGFQIREETFVLFEYEYDLPLIPHEFAAYAATIAEHVFPVLLFIGLLGRFSALALLMMTLVIQIFVYPFAWPTHGVWAVCFLVTWKYGPGAFSADALLERFIPEKLRLK